jgi:hypothetical protein
MSAGNIAAILTAIAGVITAVTALIHSLRTRTTINQHLTKHDEPHP